MSVRQRINIGPTLHYEAKVEDGHFRGFLRAFFGNAVITGVKAGRDVAPPEVKSIPFDAAAPHGQAFTWLREEAFSIGGQTHTVRIYKSNLFAAALGLSEKETDIACEFVLVPGGSFLMGSSPKVQEKMVEASARQSMLQDESPQHRVNIEPFLMARTEVTQEVWRGLAHLAGLPLNPSFFKNAGDRAPVEMASWHHVKQWLTAVNSVYDLSLRLPTEAEWEYACRAGTTTPLYNGTFPGPDRKNSSDLDEIAWYIGNSKADYKGGVNITSWGPKQYDFTHAGTQPVGGKKPNAFGLYDMLGNVLEWCEDLSHGNYHGAPTDGSAWRGGFWIPGTLLNGPMTESEPIVTVRDHTHVPGRIRRGGSWRNLAYNTRAAMRSSRGPNFTDTNNGFRLACDVPTSLRQHPEPEDGSAHRSDQQSKEQP
jgi:formylglycine-generating enzyme required for sulfatase activity